MIILRDKNFGIFSEIKPYVKCIFGKDATSYTYEEELEYISRVAKNNIERAQKGKNIYSCFNIDPKQYRNDFLKYFANLGVNTNSINKSFFNYVEFFSKFYKEYTIKQFYQDVVEHPEKYIKKGIKEYSWQYTSLPELEHLFPEPVNLLKGDYEDINAEQREGSYAIADRHIGEDDFRDIDFMVIGTNNKSFKNYYVQGKIGTDYIKLLKDSIKAQLDEYSEYFIFSPIQLSIINKFLRL